MAMLSTVPSDEAAYMSEVTRARLSLGTLRHTFV